jgi:hypothetical protein
VSPTRVGLPGKPRASGNGGWRGTQRGVRWLRGCRPTPIHIPRGDSGARRWATRTGQGCDALAACSESGVGDGVVSTPSSPAAGDRGNGEPGCRCPTGAALRPTNRRGVSGKPGWGVSPQAPEGNRREWHRRGGFGLKLLAVRIARVRSWGWDTPYGEQRMSPRVAPASFWSS